MGAFEKAEEFLNIRYLGGEYPSELGRDEGLVLSVMKNAERFLEPLIEHHLNIGFKHLVLLDNGSEDSSVEIALKSKHVLLLQSLENYWERKHHFKTYLANRFGQNSWGLLVDSDEFFEYPLREKVPLKKLLGYLNRYGYTGMVAPMLDLFRDIWIDEEDLAPFNPEAGDWFFDISAIEKLPYDVPQNQVASSKIRYWRGGIRKQLFDLNVSLSKCPLNFNDGKVIFKDSHKVLFRKIADITGILRHYKFVKNVEGGVEKFHAKQKYREGYERALQNNPEARFRMSTATRYTSPQQFQELGLYTLSEPYLNAF